MKTKAYALGVNRFLEVTKENNNSDDYKIVLKDTQTGAEAVFHRARWTFFQRYIDEIDAEVKKLKEDKENVRYRMHYGGAWHVSVTSGVRCVDLRRFFNNANDEIKPTRHGIGLRLSEWETLKDVVSRIRVDFPDLESMLGCFHGDLDDWVNCRECLPFQQQQKQQQQQHVRQ